MSSIANAAKDAIEECSPRAFTTHSCLIAGEADVALGLPSLVTGFNSLHASCDFTEHEGRSEAVSPFPLESTNGLPHAIGLHC
mmetsp:Transcript_24109/g.53894  ORF Transcript_24109/g.53894 Transcript_24109/m.53894 type:complete len:83 (-) Transcript_24109:646-894(-)